jgi:hypothetical protein
VINKTDKHPFIFVGRESQGFLEKYYSRYEIGDFFKNPWGLTLKSGGGKLSWLSVLFIS